MRQKETEPAFTCPTDKLKTGGVYHCAACDLPLFKSETKFESGTGCRAILTPLTPKMSKSVRIILLQCTEPKFCAQDANRI